MAGWIVALVLAIICVLLIHYVWCTRKQLREVAMVLHNLKQGQSQQAFAKGQNLASEVTYQVNDVVRDYRAEIIRLRRAEEANKQLLTSLSHDVRTPLTSLLGYLEALNSDLLSADEREHFLQVAGSKADELKQYVEMLFEWFKLSSQDAGLVFAAVDINEYTRELIIDWLPLLTQKGFTCQVRIADEDLIVELDQAAYKRIINNLLKNALVHSEGDQVTVTITTVDDQVHIGVADNGRGISSEQIPYVFERLYKCDASRSNQGSGLGLAIVRELVRAHGGEINVQSVEGTLFSVILPLKQMRIRNLRRAIPPAKN